MSEHSPTEATQPVGGREIADRLGVRRQTVAMWKLRGLLPPARWTVSGEDAWDWHADIEPWAKQTGRLKQQREVEADIRVTSVWLCIDARDYYARPVVAVYDNAGEANRHAEALGEAHAEERRVRTRWNGEGEAEPW